MKTDISNGTHRQAFVYGLTHDELTAKMGEPVVDTYCEDDDDGYPLSFDTYHWAIQTEAGVATVYTYKSSAVMRIGGHDAGAIEIVKGLFPHANIELA